MTLTVCSQEVVVELEERETVPGVHGLDMQRGVHVGSVQRQKGLGVFGHQLGPPGEGLRESRRHVREQEVALTSTTYPKTDIYIYIMYICPLVAGGSIALKPLPLRFS